MSAFKFFSGLIVGALILFGAGWWMLGQRRADERLLAQQNEASSVPAVSVVRPTVTPPNDDLVVAGSTQAFAESGIYARTSGYLKAWHADLGAHVKAGQLLAEIDTPETDIELQQVRAARLQLVASLELARSSAARWETLRKSDAVSQQEVDERKGAVSQQEAALAAADANIKRLEELQAYRKVYAPFAGVITKRNVDTGALITAGNASQQQLFYLSQTAPLKILLPVPEAYAPAVKPGLTATIEVPQMPGKKFTGTVSRSAEVIDPQTRTLLAQVDVPNTDAALLPGAFVQVHLKLSVAVERMQIPVNTLLFRSEGIRVAIVDDKNVVHLQPVTIGRDFGTTVEIVQGLSVTDWVILNPSDSIADKQTVHPQRPTPAAEGAAKK